ncbi:50S ribosomal protein L3 [bacterium]|nr:50S ribosomal protein L3 [bacterium]
MLTVVPAIKLGMTSVFDGAGTTMPATVMEPFDVFVLRKKTVEKDGYSALVLAFEESLPKRVNKPISGQLAKAGIDSPLKRSFEIRMTEEEMGEFEIGDLIEPKEYLTHWGGANVTARSKGRGFQGVMKRYNFKGVKATHGHTIHRKPASGGATDPARQLKGSRRPGHMGNERVTIKNLTIFEYDRRHNVIVLHGNVPGPKGGLVWIKMTRQLDEDTLDKQHKAYIETKAEEDEAATAQDKSSDLQETVVSRDDGAADTVEQTEVSEVSDDVSEPAINDESDVQITQQQAAETDSGEPYKADSDTDGEVDRK